MRGLGCMVLDEGNVSDKQLFYWEDTEILLWKWENEKKWKLIDIRRAPAIDYLWLLKFHRQTVAIDAEEILFNSLWRSNAEYLMLDFIESAMISVSDRIEMKQEVLLLIEN